jgi:aminopeptidase N
MRRGTLYMLFCLALANTGLAQRLPRNIIPEHYQLTFRPDLANGTFTGEETIDIRVLDPTPTITLNLLELQIEEASITSSGKTEKTEVKIDGQRQMAVLTTSEPLAAGAALLHIRFAGHLDDRLRGFFKVKSNGRQYAATQFEATDARRAFPCFDEPALKATFDVSLIVDRRDTAISNGKIVSDVPGPGPGKHTLKFSTSPKMASYLVMMAVGDFQCLEGSADGIPIRVCTTPDKARQGKFGLEAAEAFLGFYDRYFDTKYPFGKLDIVAVPDSQYWMENVAAILCSEWLLVDDKTSSPEARKSVAHGVAHEMAHMWFGDLVTMKWWDDIWLNEGFASWMETKPVAAWKPDWNSASDDLQAARFALDQDALEATHSIRAHVETPADIMQYVDAITYNKSAAVLRMVESYVGPEAFRHGVNAYLKKYAYDNASSEDFWNTLGEVSGKPVGGVMKSFVQQPGAPLISIQAHCDGSTISFTLTQQRYFAKARELAARSPELWQVPVCIKTESAGGAESIRCELLKDKEKTFERGGCTGSFFANAGARGYYRSSYQPEALRQIARSVEKNLTPEERLSLLGDEWGLVENGRINIGNFLTLLEGLKNDRERAVMQFVTGNLSYIGDNVVSDADRDLFRSWVRGLLGPAARELKWQAAAGDNDERRALRDTVLLALGYAGRDPETLTHARALAERVRDDSSVVDPMLAGTVLSLAALEGGPGVYQEFLSRAKSATLKEVKQRYYNALGSFRDPALLQQTLSYALTDSVPTSERIGLIWPVMSNPAGRNLGWAFIKSHWAELQRKLPSEGVKGVIHSAGNLCDARSREDAQGFFSTHKVEDAGRAVGETLEGISLCVDFKTQQQANLSWWLRQQQAANAP